MFQDTPAPATQHDRTNYGPSFITGRGNLSQTARYDVTDPNNALNTALETKWRHNSAGSVLMERDHLWHQTFYSYGDSFSDGVNRNTFAYPTQLTDADNFSSTAKFDYDTGQTTRTVDPKGAAQMILYDNKGRVQKVTNEVSGAYTEWVYPTSMGYSQQFSTVVAGAGLLRSEQHFDGAGRVRATSEPFPGSAGGYRATHVMYNSMGRVVQSAGATEINSSWIPSGDDSAAGWAWTYQTYNWQGRPLLTTNPDASTREFTYGGCGCAGGETVVARDERGRRRKTYKDVLGRLNKVEELNWDQSVYATTNYTYNVRDQLTAISHEWQPRTFTYDGHGRLASRTTPEQGTTTYAYKSDDTLLWARDARGAKSVFSYNNRHLVTGVSYDLSGVVGGQNVAGTANVSYTYDSAGNRTGMTDGIGSVTYVYNAQSQLETETRTITGVGTYSSTYNYNLAGQLQTVANPWGSQVTYTRDAAGQTTQVTGAGAWSTGTYAQGMQYRAFGGVKQVSYGNSKQLNVSYDNRQRMKTWNVGVMSWEYDYDKFGEKTGRVTYARNLNDATLDRSYDYDQVGRLTAAYTGTNARAHVGVAGGSWGVQDGPYAQTNTYDLRGNITQRTGWGAANASFTASYWNNKRDGFSYDAAGNLTNDLGQNFMYDATGQQASASYSGYSLTQAYDGDKLRVKKTENGSVTYYLRSSVLGGQVVAEINSSGGWQRGYVYDGNGQLLALQDGGYVRWVHQDPVTKSQKVTDTIGGVLATVDLDPWGGETSRSYNSYLQPRKYTTYERDGNGSDEALMRRFNRWHSRFDQPDPWDGSYDLTNPQSFNRYSYTQNDPVNFVDPSGLNLTAAECRMIAQVDPTFSNFNWLPGCNSDGDTGRRGPGDLSPGDVGGLTPEDHKPGPDDCTTFADIVDDFAKNFPSAFDFAKELYKKFAPDQEGKYFRSGGFRSDFKDDIKPGNSPNQARHVAGGIAVGYGAGAAARLSGQVNQPTLDAAIAAFNGRELSLPIIVPMGPAGVAVIPLPLTASQKADMRLNNVVVPLGFALGANQIKPNQVGEAIRNSVCDSTNR